MRHTPSHAGPATTPTCALLALFLACVPVSALDARRPDDSSLEAARSAIAARIAERVEATVRKDADALLRDAEPVWRAVDGTAITREQMAEVLRREWAPIERTVELTVRIDSLRLLHADSALVYTSQRWERIMLADDGSRHDVVSSASMEQRWAKRDGKWRGAGAPRMLREGPTLIDGREMVVVRST